VWQLSHLLKKRFSVWHTESRVGFFLAGPARVKIQVQHMVHNLKLGGSGDAVTLLKQNSLDGEQ
jgi:hypothetical protein